MTYDSFDYYLARNRAFENLLTMLGLITAFILVANLILAGHTDYLFHWPFYVWLHTSLVWSWISFFCIYCNYDPRHRRSYYYTKVFQWLIVCTGLWFFITVLRIIHSSTIDKAAESFGITTDEIGPFLTKRIYILIVLAILLFISILYECCLQRIDRRGTSDEKPLLDRADQFHDKDEQETDMA